MKSPTKAELKKLQLNRPKTYLLDSYKDYNVLCVQITNLRKKHNLYIKSRKVRTCENGNIFVKVRLAERLN